MTSSTSQVEKPARSEHNHAMAVWENEAIHLRLDVFNLDSRKSLQASHVNFVVKVPDVANNGIVLHELHVLNRDDIEIARGRHENIHLADNFLHGRNLKALHARLQCANRINLCN